MLALVVLALMESSGLPSWAEWTQFIVGMVAAAFGAWYFLKRLYDGPRTFSLTFDNGSKSIWVPIDQSAFNVQISARRPIDLDKFSLVLSDHKNGSPRARVHGLNLVDLSDGGSPASITEEHIKPSNSLIAVRLFDNPQHLTSEEPLLLSVRVGSMEAWSGYLVFVGYDEHGHRRTAHGEFTIR